MADLREVQLLGVDTNNKAKLAFKTSGADGVFTGDYVDVRWPDNNGPYYAAKIDVMMQYIQQKLKVKMD